MNWKGGTACGLIKVLFQNMHRKTAEDSGQESDQTPPEYKSSVTCLLGSYQEMSLCFSGDKDMTVYNKLLVIWYRSIQNSHTTGKNFKELIILIKLLKKQSCDAFIYHMIVL
jgi:hypothetical protein